MDVAIIGGGIVGCASAYYLRKRGADVTLLEKGSIGNGSTERSAGGIRCQFTTPINVELSKASIDVWERFESTFGVDIQYRRNGYLFVGRTEETAELFESNVEMQNRLGVPTELLDPAGIEDRFPHLRTGAFTAGTYHAGDGFADPHLALQGFATKAGDIGVDIRTKTPVTDVVRDGESVTGVVAGGERVDADFVVNAAGPWAGRVAELAGLSLPVSARRRQVLVADPDGALPETAPLTIDLDTGAYFRPEREGSVLVGGHFDGDDPEQDPDGYAKSTDLGWTATVLERASEASSVFGPETGVKRGWAGLYAVTPDHHPVVEESVPGFINAVGFSGHGFQQAPATGRIVAELVFTGEASLVDIGPLSSERFETGELLEERNVA